MTATSHSALEFAVSRLRWCLNQPLFCDGQDWGASVYRALEQFSEALERHIDFLERVDGPLAQIADPSLLPFTLEAKRARDLRGRHNRLREQVQAVRLQFRDALVLFPCNSGVPEDGIADAHAFRLYGILGSPATSVLDAIEDYQAAEASLLGGTQDTLEVFKRGNSSATSGEPGERFGSRGMAR
jgi:hypothetical protein